MGSEGTVNGENDLRRPKPFLGKRPPAAKTFLERKVLDSKELSQKQGLGFQRAFKQPF
jgi:hypothetical protein